MKYIVILDGSSVIGATYLLGTNDGTTATGHPILDCLSVEQSGSYLACIRDMSNKGGSRQSLLIPHAAVAYVQGYAATEDRPMGFG